MPELVNRNDHGVRAVDENGNTVRLRAGQVANVDGKAADQLSAYEGVESASSDDKEAWDAQRNASKMTTVTAGKQSLEESMGEARGLARAAGVAVPLNQVIGDDDAPLGPPSGTITTKAAVAKMGDREAAAFGGGERQPEEADNEKLSEVERAQAEAKARLEELHQEVLQDASEQGNESAAPGDVEASPQTSKGRRKKADSSSSSDNS